MEDGRVSAVIEGVQRYYVEAIVSENPYKKARIRPFVDYTENPDILHNLELQIYSQIKRNIKVSF